MLGDWYINLLIIQRQHLLLAVSERTLLPIVLPAKDLKSFPRRLPLALADVLRELAVPEQKIKQELSDMEEVTLAKTASRQVLGSMNDFANLAEAFLQDCNSLLKLSLRLGATPCGPIDMKYPIEVAANLFGANPPRHFLIITTQTSVS